MPQKVSSGDTGGLRDIALIGGWALSSFALYTGVKRFGGSLLGDSAEALISTECATRFVGFAALGAALALVALLLFGRKVGANATVLEPNQDETQRYHEEEGVTRLMPTAGFSIGKQAKPGSLKRFTLAEVAAHDKKDDLWIVVDKKAYDVTGFVESHPGGVGPMAALAGKDCTDVFANYHAIKVYKYMLPRYCVGEVTDVEDWEHVEDFRAVRQELLRRGLFETDYRYYAMFALWYASLFLGAVWLSVGGLGDEGPYCSWGRIAGAVAMGLFWQQLAGLGHDLGHSGVTHNFHKDHQIGSALTAFMGLSLCWWKSDHNTHHVVCNALEHDPNIQHMPIMAIHEKIFAKVFWDSYHKRWVAMDAVARFLVSWQHVLFYPIMFFARVNLYVQGIIFLLSKPDTIHYRMSELTGLAVYGSWLIALVSAQPTYADCALWMLASHGVAGVLHVQIVLSHWGMDVYEGRAYNDKDDEWYTMQLKTTMNVATYEPLDWVHIGLQFQVEHHLFPRLPRHSLRAARELVIPVCKKHGLEYHEPGFFEGNLEMWTALRDAAVAARKTTKGDGGFYTSKLWEGINLSG